MIINTYTIYWLSILYYFCNEESLFELKIGLSSILGTKISWASLLGAFIFIAFQMNSFQTTQVENYGPVPAGKHRESLECGSSIPIGNFSDFFRWFPTGSCRKSQEIDWSPPEKIQQISGRNTASISGCFRCFPTGSGDFHASFL